MISTDTRFKLIESSYPHIADQIELFWGYDGFSVVMSKLLNDSREGSRQGFPIDVARAMLSLYKQHQDEFPGL